MTSHQHSPAPPPNLLRLCFKTTPDRPTDLPLPSYAKPGDAGLDLVAMEGCGLPPEAHALIRTGICVEIPDGFVGIVAPRSGLAAKHGVAAVLGVIDAGYRNEVKVNLMNHGERTYEVKAGDRIAQLLILPCMRADLVQVESLAESERGTSGFGSSGR